MEAKTRLKLKKLKSRKDFHARAQECLLQVKIIQITIEVSLKQKQKNPENNRHISLANLELSFNL